MKIACITDTHGDPLPQIDTKFDKWLHAGDLYNLGVMFHPDRANTIQKWLSDKDAYFVLGNHDIPQQIHYHNISGTLVELAPGLLLAGIGWSGYKYYDLPEESDIEAICRQLMRQIIVRRKENDRLILLSHYPPALDELFANDNRRRDGFYYRSVMNFINETKPFTVVYGHVHNYADIIVDGIRYINPIGRIVTLEV